MKLTTQEYNFICDNAWFGNLTNEERIAAYAAEMLGGDYEPGLVGDLSLRLQF